MQYDTGLSEDAFYAERLISALRDGGVAACTHTVVKFGKADAIAAIAEVVRVTETYDPNTIRASIPMYLLARHIAENTDIKVVLSGEGADELFAGYSYFSLAPTPVELKAETRRLVGNLHMFDLLRADRCFAAFGLEVRVPFLDQDVVRHVLDSVAVRGSEKAALRDAFRDVESLVKARVLDRPKERFSDGCGFSYVPQLLNHVSESAATLTDKLSGEKRFYDAVFDELYPNSRYWIVNRTMPPWASQGVVDDTLVF